MVIHLVGPTYPFKGGIALHTTVLAQQLQEHGHDVRIESWARQFPARLYPGQMFISDETTPRFRLVTRAMSWNRPDTWVRAGRRIGSSGDLVVVVLATPIQVPAYLCVVRTARQSHRGALRVVGICHNVVPHERRPGDAMLMRQMLRQVDRTIVHTEVERRAAQALGAADPVHRDLPLFHGSLPTAASVDRGFDSGTLLFFGIVRPYKGLDVLLRALVRVERVRLVVAGEFWGDGESETRQLANDLGIADRVDIRPGFVPDSKVASLFNEIDAVVLPYVSATGSQNVMTAFAHGKPVIATDVIESSSMVRHGTDGFVVKAGNVTALAGAITAMFEPDTITRMTASVTRPDASSTWPDYLQAVLG